MAKTDTTRVRQEYRITDYLERKGLKLKQRGREWDACCPFHAEDTPSFQVFDKGDGQRFYCHGCAEHGDILDLVGRFEGIEGFKAQVAFLGGSDPGRPLPSPEGAGTYVDPYEGVSVVPGGPELKPGLVPYWNPKAEKESRVKAVAVYDYGVGYKVRFYVEDRKAFLTLQWADNGRGRVGWTQFPFPEPVPLYGLARVKEKPSATFVLFEGEKKADLFNGLGVPGTIGIGFDGGSTRHDRIDWSPLADKKVVLWPDNDRAGINSWLGTKGKTGLAERLLELGVHDLRFVAPMSGKNDGWNVDDALEEGWTKEQVVAHIKNNLKEYRAVKELKDAHRATVESLKQGATEAAQVEEKRAAAPANLGYDVPIPDVQPAPRDWMIQALVGDNGIKSKPAWNHQLWLTLHPIMWKAVGYDEFAQRVVWLRRMPWHRRDRQALDDDDLVHVETMMSKDGLDARRQNLGPMLTAIARRNAMFHPVREYLEGLKWDGVERIDTWLVDYCGAKNRFINWVFGRKWLIAAVARVMDPGCKVDAMLVLEGAQNLGKSSVFKIMGGAVSPSHVHENLGKIGDKDTLIALAGKWVAEMAELEALSRTSASEMKAWITTARDTYRRPYASTAEEHPRQFVLGGTVNPNGLGYLKDETGNRRFWPVAVTAINQAALLAIRDQLWAEAYARWKRGDKWWLEQGEYEEAEVLTSSRREVDPWLKDVEEYVGDAVTTSIPDIMLGMGLDAGQRTKAAQMRVASILKELGFDRTLGYDDQGRKTRLWRR